LSTSEAYAWKGRELHGQEGEKIGTIKEIYEDAHTGRPEWALVTSGLLGKRSHFVPLAGAQPAGDDVRVNVTKDQVTSAPSIDDDDELSEAEERRLFEHYGVPYTDEGSVTAQGGPQGAGGRTGQDEFATRGARGGAGREADLAREGEYADEGEYAREGELAGRGGEGYDTSGPTTDEAMTRSEEELRVGTTQRERGRARLRKYVVTEEVQTTVPVQREEVRIEREPITEETAGRAMEGPDISEEEHEVILHEEEPVVEKRAVPKERVRLAKDTVTEEQQVSGEVRKERIEPEGEDI